VLVLTGRSGRARRPRSSCREVPPALIAPALTAASGPLRAAQGAAGDLRAGGARFRRLALLARGDRFFLPLVLALGLVDGTLAITGRGLTRGAVAVVLQPQACSPRATR
jgi:hypothetical protein